MPDYSPVLSGKNIRETRLSQGIMFQNRVFWFLLPIPLEGYQTEIDNLLLP
jgi:hypothetical protein